MYRIKSAMTIVFSVITLLMAQPVFAENSQDFGDYVVHFNALSTNSLPATVTKQYGIKRSKNRGMINIAVLAKTLGTTGKPVAGKVSASARNLTGQKREIPLREIREGTAIYYIGEFPVTHEETLRFLVNVTPEDTDESHEVKFKQQFFTQ
ncbi:MAG: DUF4426 domain-containing protein [Gammaproteobacteria bacterium]